MNEQEHPWLSLRHRIRELPGVLYALLAGKPYRRRLVRIVNRRHAICEQEARHG